MTPWQKKFYEISTQKRDKILRPVSWLLTKLRLSPNTITLSGIISMLFFVYFLPQNPRLALGFVFLTIFLDMLDGALARFQKISSDRGKFIDVSADALNFSLFLFGLGWAGFIDPSIITILIFSAIISRTLRILYNSSDFPSDWLFRPVAGCLPNVISFSCYFLFTLEIFLDYAIITGQIIFGFTIILLIDSGRHFYKILQKS